MLFIHQLRPSHCLIEQIKQQETYADMTARHIGHPMQHDERHTHRFIVTLVSFYSLKVAKFQWSKRKASINAIQYV